ncbi:amidase [Halieaceae bacterium IMCC14734]|uniref:Amidase n=1 Tax=Candidatus Litorirhabdus singularis TaxID=2518993 RepID=A0ABT3TN37_9GAMM|nr:amidase [Candidatus Litorirhabdus singularis]MCX2982784.1 amidase [Candidatus Litorirhabdus singularis]
MDPLYRSAFALADDIRAGSRSSRELLEFFLQRIERFNPALNAVVALDTERARARADAADAAVAAGEDWGPLHGVPITIKDALATEGLVTVGGIPACKDNVPEQSAVAVQRYVDAGAIIFAKTNVPFMSADLQTYNDVYGVTNNPWDVTRTSGGSSGGAAAALAAGLTPLELGSDIGGSIRTPSHFNGVYGHKPSFNLVPQRGHLPPGDGVLSEGDLSVIGPLGTCPQDLEKALDIVAGPLPEEGVAWQVQLPAARATAAGDLRVAVWLDHPAFPVDDEIQAAIAAAAQTLADAGAQVDLEARPQFDVEEQHSNYAMLLSAVMGAGMPEAVFEGASAAVAAADPDDRSLLMQQMRGIAQSHREWLRQNEKRQHYRAQWAQFFQSYDVLLCPCASVTAFPHDHNPDLYQRQLQVNGKAVPYLNILGWAGLTLNSYLPVTAAPVGVSSEGLPIGMQIVGPYLEDRTPLAVAGMLQQLHRGFVAPPGY